MSPFSGISSIFLSIFRCGYGGFHMCTYANQFFSSSASFSIVQCCWLLPRIEHPVVTLCTWHCEDHLSLITSLTARSFLGRCSMIQNVHISIIIKITFSGSFWWSGFSHLNVLYTFVAPRPATVSKRLKRAYVSWFLIQFSGNSVPSRTWNPPILWRSVAVVLALLPEYWHRNSASRSWLTMRSHFCHHASISLEIGQYTYRYKTTVTQQHTRHSPRA